MANRYPLLRHRAAGYLVLCILLISICAAGYADSLSDQINTLLQGPSLQHGLQGVMVKSLTTGATLYEHNADAVMIPASNMKLLVSAAILDRLGPDFTYKTEVFTSGDLTPNGVLYGDLIIKGAGDPVLLTADLVELAKQVKAQGITRISGNLLTDDTLFDNQRLGWGWSWDDEPYYYSAQISALTLNRNTIDVWVNPGKKEGSPAEVRLDPPTRYMTIDNTAATGKADSRKSLSVDRKRGANVIQVSGSVPLNYKPTWREEPITMEEPALYAGDVFRRKLDEEGVKLQGSVRLGKLPKDAKPICSHASPPLSKILALLNKPSDNLIAETLLKTIGAVAKDKGTYDNGIEAEREFFQRIGMDMSELVMVDGSGLSRLNYISPRNFVTLLSAMHAHKYAKSYIDSLPIAGVDGSLSGRMKGTAAEKNLKAKTGYVSRVCTLAGYVKTKSGDDLVLSIMLNNHLCPAGEARAVEDKICELLANL